MAKKALAVASKLHFSKKDIEGCFETETVYIVAISTPTGVRHERLYTRADNDEAAREAFECWLNKSENSVYKNDEFRERVIVHKQTRILISTRMA